MSIAVSCGCGVMIWAYAGKVAKPITLLAASPELFKLVDVDVGMDTDVDEDEDEDEDVPLMLLPDEMANIVSFDVGDCFLPPFPNPAPIPVAAVGLDVRFIFRCEVFLARVFHMVLFVPIVLNVVIVLCVVHESFLVMETQ